MFPHHMNCFQTHAGFYDTPQLAVTLVSGVGPLSSNWDSLGAQSVHLSQILESGFSTDCLHHAKDRSGFLKGNVKCGKIILK